MICSRSHITGEQKDASLNSGGVPACRDARSTRATLSGNGAEGQSRTVDTGIFSAVLYHLSYLGREANVNPPGGRCPVVSGQLLTTGYCLRSRRAVSNRLAASLVNLLPPDLALSRPWPVASGRWPDARSPATSHWTPDTDRYAGSATNTGIFRDVRPWYSS